MLEGRHRDVADEFPVDAVNQIEVEPGSDPLRVVICRQEDCLVLQQVDSQEQSGIRTKGVAKRPKEIDSGRFAQVAEGRAREKANATSLQDRKRQLHRTQKVPLDRPHGNMRELGL